MKYEYTCSKCEGTTDLFVSLSECDKKQDCDLCGAEKALTRVECAGNVAMNPNGAFQFGYVMGDGQRLPGKTKQGPKAKRLKSGK